MKPKTNSNKMQFMMRVPHQLNVIFGRAQHDAVQ